jgi:hypothetical protein
MTEAAADALSSIEAAALLNVLDLQAEWQNLKEDGRDYSTARLQELQRTFEAFRVGLADYATLYRADPVPERTPTAPDQLAVWCRITRAVVQRADPWQGNRGAAQVASRAYRLADGLAGRLCRKPVARLTDAATRDDVLAVLESVGTWCESLTGHPPTYETVPR